MGPHQCRTVPFDDEVGVEATGSTPLEAETLRQLAVKKADHEAFVGDPSLIATLTSKILALPPTDLPLLHMVLVGLASERPLRFNSQEVLAAVPVSQVETRRQADGAVSLKAVTRAGRQWSLKMHEEASRALLEALAAVVGPRCPPARLSMAFDESAGRQ